KKAEEKKPEPKKAEEKKPEEKKAKKSSAREFNPPKSNGKPMVVIDPGHGGVDPGASGDQGSIEKDIVLEYAETLKAKLLKSGNYRVVLTRDSDEFIMLRQRVEIARSNGASIFISLHADSAPGGARGLSIYTVSEKASDEEAQALAARENKADVLAGMNLATEREDVADILISLARTAPPRWPICWSPRLKIR
ncbi:MAG: N-acetylmuramoyl-L-alanine amidase, partial [Proteobacteria bacterium]|nr:N-acetylmuramoyl-L-alanine amidase [Pseudomonadota bacterium]